MRAVLKFGGSIIMPNNLDSEFLKKLAEKLKIWSETHQLAVVVGGGATSREYDKLARKFIQNEKVLDMFGIFAARANAYLLLASLGEKACPLVPNSEQEFLQLTKTCPRKIIVAGGFRPGQRTDAVAVEIAKVWKADLVIKGTDVDYIYDKDPKKSKDAKPIKKMDYGKLKKLADKKHEANKPTIMDKVAAQILINEKIKLAVVNGKDLANIEKALSGKKFKGTKVGF